MKLKMGPMRLRSKAFEMHGRISDHYSGYGDDVSPPLEWSDAPKETKSFALICHDPDAPLPRGFTHWVVCGIPPSTIGIPEGGGAAFTEGVNGSGKHGYIGPMPPPGHGPHYYYFWLYALDTEVHLGRGVDREKCLAAIEDHVIEQSRLVGVYEKK
jgi:Raf kinase inhibitor-like YbhB/YbcL family protein